VSGVLLDTHTVLWAGTEEGVTRLSAVAKRHIETRECFFSCASIPDMAIKHSLGNLRFPNDLTVKEYVELSIEKLRLMVLPVRVPESCLLALLPHHHHDPFDRVLIAQAKVNDLAILSRNSHFDRYDVQRVW
jgi:PIN domain nuclease of toxin-antitoxin system